VALVQETHAAPCVLPATATTDHVALRAPAPITVHYPTSTQSPVHTGNARAFEPGSGRGDSHCGTQADGRPNTLRATETVPMAANRATATPEGTLYQLVSAPWNVIVPP
jgi:hypothetical protein